MSGDVQPRKRKDKRRKKDELGVEEPRGTAAAFGDGDVLMHSHHDHGTGGHWCAKIIFFSLLAVLVTLIGLIILENRGLSELEANAVESRYSGVLDGWIEDAHDDDHHDEHTLELKHHSYEDTHDDNDELDHDEDIEDEHSQEHDDEEDVDDEEIDEQSNSENDISEEKDEQNIYDEDDNQDNSEEHETEVDGEKDMEDNDSEEDDEDESNIDYAKFNKYRDDGDDGDDDDDDDEENDNIDRENFQKEERDDDDSEENLGNYLRDDDDNDDLGENTSVEHGFYETKNDKSVDSYEKEDLEQDEADDDDETDEEIEKIEKEVNDDDEQAISDEDNDEIEKELGDDVSDEDDDDDAAESLLESEDISAEPPVVEHITVPSGKPFVELDEELSAEKPTDTLVEEEEYERRQEQLRQQKQESSSQMWLKLVVGGALLVATHAVIRRSTAPSDTSEVEDNTTREETPSLVDRRMTLIPNESTPLVPHETYEPAYEEPVQKVVSEIKSVQSTPISKHESDEEEESALLETEVMAGKAPEQNDKELYSDEEDDDEQEIVEAEKESVENVEKEAEESEPEETPDDVEIIDDEQIEEEMEEDDEDEEEISDVDDTELLSRLEAKYGRLPEPHRPGQQHKDGGDSIEDEWPGEPSDQYWRQQLDQAEREIRQGEWTSANGRLAAVELANSGRARWLAARSLDAQADAQRDNTLLTRAISAYLHLLKMYERLSDTKLREVTTRALDRIQFRGNYLSAEPVYRLLIRRFPNEVSYRNNLTISFLMANKADLASDVLKETLKLWPDDRIALAHYAFVLKTNYNKLEESVALFRKALENDEGPACEPRFYYHLGDALLLLNRFDEAHEVHKRGARHGHFLSPAQRSLYNVERLKSRPWWRIEQTPYAKLARALEQSWEAILKEGVAAKTQYEKEKEGLKEKGEWSQLDMFVRGQEIPGRCKRAPVTCSIVKTEKAASNCRRGQIKFSSMEPGTHVRPHVGPTNCRLRMHLGLSNTKDTYIRVDQEVRQWQTGKVLLFDDSFEHEVWHNGTGTRLVLIVDVWHPDLTAAERRQLPAI